MAVSHEVTAAPGLRETLLGAVQGSFATRADSSAFTYLADGEIGDAQTSTFAELDRATRALAAELQASGVRPGDRVMLLLTPGRDMVVGFLACVFAGAIAVPAYPPSPFIGVRGLERLQAILKDAGAAFVLTESAVLPSLQFAREESRPLSLVFVDQCAGAADAFDPVEVTPDDAAFLQYTSGSTSDPRGVRVTHGALMANIRMIAEALSLDRESIACSWLPPFHDMGLIGMILTPLALGFPTVQMAPEAFLQRPVRWLKAISHYGATVAFAPNFSFDICVRRIPESELDGLDLSSWAVAGNGAEPIREHTLAEFERKFAVCGFQQGAMWPGYGLAEATLLVTASQRGPGTTVWVDPEQLSQGRVAPVDKARGRPLVSCGWPLPGAQVTICDPVTGEQLEQGVVGEIRISGPLVCDGYWRNPELTAETFTDAGLRTGDLGALWQGQLYVTGRLKDLLIVRGLNHYPQDIEQTMEVADPSLRRGCGVAVAVPTDTGELLALVQEVRNGSDGDPRQIVQKIRRLVVEQHGVAPDVIVLVPPRSIPQTTSGKVRRGATAEALRAGAMQELYRWPAGVEG